MDVLDRPTIHTGTHPLNHEPDEYRWAITLTRRSTHDPHTVFETYKVAYTPDQLCDIVLHSSLDPSIVAYTYHRYVQPNTPATPTSCDTCDEPFTITPPRQHWRTGPCGTAHIQFNCRACGTDQTSPQPGCC